MFWKQNRCKKGKQCEYSHAGPQDKAVAAAPNQPASSSAKPAGKAGAKPKAKKGKAHPIVPSLAVPNGTAGKVDADPNGSAPHSVGAPAADSRGPGACTPAVLDSVPTVPGGTCCPVQRKAVSFSTDDVEVTTFTVQKLGGPLPLDHNKRHPEYRNPNKAVFKRKDARLSYKQARRVGQRWAKDCGYGTDPQQQDAEAQASAPEALADPNGTAG